VKAAFFKDHGGAEKILYDDYRDPVAEAGEVVVRVRACALNQVDMLLLDGRFPPPEGLPHVNGCEVTGTVEAVGAGVKGLAPGQRVIIFPGFACGRCEYCLRGARTVCVRYGYLGAHKDGGYAELVKAPAANILPLAEAISFEAGAAVPMAMLTSWHALVAQAGRTGSMALAAAAMLVGMVGIFETIARAGVSTLPYSDPCGSIPGWLLYQPYRAALRCFRRNVAYAQTRSAAGEAPVGKQGAHLAHVLRFQIRGGIQHLLHARPALGSFIADHHHVARHYPVSKNGLHRAVLALENARAPVEL